MFMTDWVNVNNNVMSHNIKQYKLRTPQNKVEQSQFHLRESKGVSYSFSLMPTSRINEQYKCRISDSLFSVMPSFLDGENFSSSSLVKYQECMHSCDDFSRILGAPSISMSETPCWMGSLQPPLNPDKVEGSLISCILDIASFAKQPVELTYLQNQISTTLH